MRKLLALCLIAMMALGLSFAVVGCGAPQQEQQVETTPPPAEEMPPAGEMPMDTAATAPTEGGQ